MKRRKGSRVKKGHRQNVSVVKIEKIALGSQKKSVKEEQLQEVPQDKEAKNGS